MRVDLKCVLSHSLLTCSYTFLMRRLFLHYCFTFILLTLSFLEHYNNFYIRNKTNKAKLKQRLHSLAFIPSKSFWGLKWKKFNILDHDHEY